jgi:hypothetical protein
VVARGERYAVAVGGDLVPEGFELAGEAACRASVGGAVEVIIVEGRVVTVVGHQVPVDEQDAVAPGERRPGLALLRERAQREPVRGRQTAGSAMGGCTDGFARAASKS